MAVELRELENMREALLELQCQIWAKEEELRQHRPQRCQGDLEEREDEKELKTELKECDKSFKCMLGAIGKHMHGTIHKVVFSLGYGPPEHNHLLCDGRPSPLGAHQRPFEKDGDYDLSPSGRLPNGMPFPYRHRPGHLHSRFARHIPGLLFLVIGVYVVYLLFTRRCCSPRRLQERLARRIERRNRRAYRRAAYRQKLKSFFNRFCPHRTAPRHEKACHVSRQEDILESVMQEEIRQLRQAADVVSDLVQAEEGRARPYSDSLPDYRSEAGSSILGDPPTYEDGETEDVGIADGFQYTPSASVATSPPSIATPDGSIASVESEPRKD